MKSVYLFFGMRRASSVEGYQISVTRVRGCLVRLSVRVVSTNTVVVTPTGNGPAESGSGGLAFTVLLDAPSGASIATINSTCIVDVIIRLRIVFSHPRVGNWAEWLVNLSGDQMGKNPCESVKSASSVVYEFKRIALLVPDRPRMTLIRRICMDTAPSLAICLLQATSSRPSTSNTS